MVISGCCKGMPCHHEGWGRQSAGPNFGLGFLCSVNFVRLSIFIRGLGMASQEQLQVIDRAKRAWRGQEWDIFSNTFSWFSLWELVIVQSKWWTQPESCGERPSNPCVKVQLWHEEGKKNDKICLNVCRFQESNINLNCNQWEICHFKKPCAKTSEKSCTGTAP